MNLAHLPQLKNVNFDDINWGGNPICKLANYQVFMLHNLKQIQSLDGVAITEEMRNAYESTFLKKKMYYNMKTKFLTRNTSSVLQQAKDAKDAKVRQIFQGPFRNLWKQQKALQRELDERRMEAEETGLIDTSEAEKVRLVVSGEVLLNFRTKSWMRNCWELKRQLTA
jgi:hypothetical protein